MYKVYVLKSKKDGKFYYGFTQNLERRLIEHNKGWVRSTRKRVPFEIVYYEKAKTRIDARRKEKYFKSGFGRKFIKNKINQTAPSSNG